MSTDVGLHGVMRAVARSGRVGYHAVLAASGAETMFYQHLHLSQWPFAVVPRPEYCTFIAGRPQLKADIADLLRALSRRDTSSIHVLWSSFGAGKTHSLYYIASEARGACAKPPAMDMVPIYTEFPEQVRGFVDLYRALRKRNAV